MIKICNQCKSKFDSRLNYYTFLNANTKKRRAFCCRQCEESYFFDIGWNVCLITFCLFICIFFAVFTFFVLNLLF